MGACAVRWEDAVGPAARPMRMRLVDLVQRSVHPDPWAEGDNIPWHEPGFSARMLREHLSQAHDAASRRAETIGRQVAWIHETLLAGAPAHVLDLGCGPGLYAGRLAALGHRCHGIDISPASIRYARERAAEAGWACDYVEGDLRRAGFGRDHDLAMLLYGELNVFAPDDALLILRKAHAALRPGGRLLLEPHTLARIERLGAEPPTWSSSASGLFSDAPHLLLMEHAWHAGRQAATVRYYVLDAATAQVERHAQTMQGYDEAGYRALLARAGFGDLRFHASLTGRDADAEPGLFGLSARAVAVDGAGAAATGPEPLPALAQPRGNG
jgi:SAM-dependent methyltransferase